MGKSPFYLALQNKDNPDFNNAVSAFNIATHTSMSPESIFDFIVRHNIPIDSYVYDIVRRKQPTFRNFILAVSKDDPSLLN